MRIFSLICVLIVVTVLSGCGSKYPAVSGTVTANGKPVPNVDIIFSPLTTKGNYTPGPLFKATTDSEGRFVMATRDGIRGATRGRNAVRFRARYSVDVRKMEMEVTGLMIEANGDTSHPSFKKAMAVNEEVRVIKSSKDPLAAIKKTEFVVPAEGTDQADFDLLKL